MEGKKWANVSISLWIDLETGSSYELSMPIAGSGFSSKLRLPAKPRDVPLPADVDLASWRSSFRLEPNDTHFAKAWITNGRIWLIGRPTSRLSSPPAESGLLIRAPLPNRD